LVAGDLYNPLSSPDFSLVAVKVGDFCITEYCFPKIETDSITLILILYSLIVSLFSLVTVTLK